MNLKTDLEHKKLEIIHDLNKFLKNFDSAHHQVYGICLLYNTKDLWVKFSIEKQ